MIKSLPQLVIEGATLAAIDLGAKDDAEKYSRAQVALAVAGIFTSLSSGDVATAVTTASESLLSKIKDPGQVALVTNLANAGSVFIQAASLADGALPLLNATWQGLAGEIAAGVTAIASAYKPSA